MKTEICQKKIGNMLAKFNKDSLNSSKRETVSKKRSKDSWMLRKNKKSSKPRRSKRELKRPSKREELKKQNKRREIRSTDRRTGREPMLKSNRSTSKLKI